MIINNSQRGKCLKCSTLTNHSSGKCAPCRKTTCKFCGIKFIENRYSVGSRCTACKVKNDRRNGRELTSGDYVF